jgi:hypothetical protein
LPPRADETDRRNIAMEHVEIGSIKRSVLFASKLDPEKAPVNRIHAQRGRANLSTTDPELSHLIPTLVVETMKARIWSL